MNHEVNKMEYWSAGVLEWWGSVMDYWDIGVLEYWVFKRPLLHYSITPLLLAWVLAAALWLAGCMVGPDYKRPTMETPPQFRAARTPDAATSIADLKWFELFQDEHLKELIRVALAQNYDLRDAIARVDAAPRNLGVTGANHVAQFGLGARGA